MEVRGVPFLTISIIVAFENRFPIFLELRWTSLEIIRFTDLRAKLNDTNFELCNILLMMKRLRPQIRRVANVKGILLIRPWKTVQRRDVNPTVSLI